MIRVHVKAMREALAACLAVVESRNTIPILSNVLIEAEPAGKQLALTATDLDLQIRRPVALEEGLKADAGAMRLTVGADLLGRIMGKLPGDATAELSHAEKDGRLTVTAGRSRFVMPTLPVTDFPILAGVEEDGAAHFELDCRSLAAVIAAEKFAISTEEARYYLNGILLHATEGAMLTAAATDGHKLVRYRMDAPDGANAMRDTIVGRKMIGVIEKLIAHADEGAAMEVSIAPRRIRFLLPDDSELIGKPIDGQFPDYTRVIPPGGSPMRFDPVVLAQAVDRVASVATDKTRAVKMDVARDLVTLSVTSPENGTATEEVPVDWDGEPLSIGFNGKYWGELLGRLGESEAEVMLSTGEAPTLWRAMDGAGGKPPVIFVLMPMRV